jgi:hypothetical protein
MKHYAVKTYGEVDLLAYVFLTSELAAGEWLALLLGRFTPGKEPPVPIG